MPEVPQLHEHTHYAIKVEGVANGSLGDLADRFGPVEVASVEEKGGHFVTTLTGMAADQAELVGLIRHLHGLGIVLLSVEQATPKAANRQIGEKASG
jgi:hypothetical protein